jgi:ABC-type antimicrobial peptide transport system permease subunit
MPFWVDRQAWVFKRMTSMMALFAAIALAMGTARIYGVTACGACRRTSEVGLRMALGASRRGVLAMFLEAGIVRALTGIAVGLPLSFLLTGALARVMFGVDRVSAVACIKIAILMIVATLLASFVPAYRASKVDPMTALRCE